MNLTWVESICGTVYEVLSKLITTANQNKWNYGNSLLKGINTDLLLFLLNVVA